jgi:hypothetical protein
MVHSDLAVGIDCNDQRALEPALEVELDPPPGTEVGASTSPGWEVLNAFRSAGLNCRGTVPGAGSLRNSPVCGSMWIIIPEEPSAAGFSAAGWGALLPDPVCGCPDKTG